MADRRHEATYRAITAGRSPHTEVTDWRSSLRIYIAAAGSETAAARQLDVPRRTLRNWLGKFGKEITPPADRRAHITNIIQRAQRRVRLKPGREQRLRKAKSITIEGVDRYDGNPRKVTFIVGGAKSTGLKADVMDKLIDKYLTGGGATSDTPQNDGIANEIVRGITDTWYRDFFSADGPDWGVDIDTVKINQK